MNGMTARGSRQRGATSYCFFVQHSASVVALAGCMGINRASFGSVESPAGGQSRHTNVGKVFGVLMIVTAPGMAFAHGSSDVANAIGPGMLRPQRRASVSQTSAGGTLARFTSGPNVRTRNTLSW